MAEKKKEESGFVNIPLLKDVLRVSQGNPLARTILKQLQAGTFKRISFDSNNLGVNRTLTIPQINRRVALQVRKPTPMNDLKMPEVKISFTDLFGRFPRSGLDDTGRAALQWALSDQADVGPKGRASYDLQPLGTGRARLYRRWFQGLRRGTGKQAPVFPYSANRSGDKTKPIQRGDRAGNIWQSRNALGQYGPQVIWDPKQGKQALQALASVPLRFRRASTANPYIQGAMLADDVIKATTGKRTLEHSKDQLTKTLEKDPTINFSPLLPF